MESVRNVQVRLFLGVLIGIAGGMFIAEALPFVIWWLAIPIGAVLGGAVFAAPEVRRAVPVAARSAWQSCTNLPKYWKQYRQASYQGKLAGYILASSLLTLIVIPLVSWFLFANLSRGTSLTDKIIGGILTALFTALYVLITLGVGSSPLIVEDGGRKRIHIFLASPVGLVSAALYMVVVAGCYAVLRGMRAMKTAMTQVPQVIVVTSKILLDVGRFVVRFLLELFWQVNSRPLAITAIGSGLGVGMFFPLFRLMWQLEILPAAIAGAPIGAAMSLAYYQFRPQRALKAH